MQSGANEAFSRVLIDKALEFSGWDLLDGQQVRILLCSHLLRDVEELSTEDTAEMLGMSVPAVKTRLHRARLALREAIGRYFSP